MDNLIKVVSSLLRITHVSWKDTQCSICLRLYFNWGEDLFEECT